MQKKGVIIVSNNLKEWYIDVCIAPVEGQLEKRVECIQSYAEQVDATGIISLVKMYYGIDVSEAFITSFADHFSENDESFSARYKKELILLVGAVLVKILETGNKNEVSLVELLSLICSRFRTSISTEGIADVIKEQFDKDRILLREKNGHNKPVANAKLDIVGFKNLTKEFTWDEPAFTKLIGVMESIQKSISTINSTLYTYETSQSIYKEDSQILWWMSSEWSNELKCSLKDVEKSKACLIIGKEAADFITNFPGPYSMEGVLNKILRSCKGNSDKIELPDLIMQLDEKWKKQYVEKIEDSPIIKLLPLCSAMARSINTDNSEQWYPQFMKEIMSKKDYIPLTLKEYAWQMYLEAMAYKCFSELEKV